MDDSIEAQFRPQVKILKRQVNENGLTDSQTSRTTAVKSLEERQMEYMKARERILGSAVPTEYGYDEDEKEVSSTSDESSRYAINNNRQTHGLNSS